MAYVRTTFIVLLLFGLAAAAQDLDIIELPHATVGVAYKTAITIQVITPFQLSVSEGQLPDGLMLDPTGFIHGTATIVGKNLFILNVTGGDNESREIAFSLNVVSDAQSTSETGAHQRLQPQKKQPFTVNVSAPMGRGSRKVAPTIQTDAADPAGPESAAEADPPQDVKAELTIAQHSALDFGTQVLGSQGASKDVAITNGAAPTPAPPKVSISGGSCDQNCDFVVADNGCNDKLVPNASCHVKVAFLPRHAGPVTAQLKVGDLVQVDLSGVGQSWGTPATRMVAGIDATAASSADTKQQFFVEAMLTAPLRLRHLSDNEYAHEDPLDRRLWVFANPTIMSVPQAASPIAGLNINGDFFNPILNGKTTDIVQAFDLKFGTELFLIKPREGAHFWAEYPDTEARLAVALVAMGGFTTPFSTTNRTSPVFVVNSSISNQFPDVAASGKTNVAFVTPDRSRFLRSYYAGLRFKTYFFSTKSKDENGNQALYNLFPGTADFTVGQDESITGGNLSGPVFRVEGVYPLPYQPAFHIFASASLGLSRNVNMNPLSLQPAASTVAVTDPSVFLRTVPLPNRDSFRIGVGLDLIQLFNRKPTSKPGGESKTTASQ